MTPLIPYDLEVTMSQYRMTVLVDIDDDALASHDGTDEAPPNDVTDWYGTDLAAAVDKGIAEIAFEEIEDIERVDA